MVYGVKFELCIHIHIMYVYVLYVIYVCMYIYLYVSKVQSPQQFSEISNFFSLVSSCCEIVSRFTISDSSYYIISDCLSDAKFKVTMCEIAKSSFVRQVFGN